MGSATTVTVVAPIVALPVTLLHWLSPIHNQVGSPTYVIKGGCGAMFTVGFTNGIDSTTVCAIWPGSGGVSPPGTNHVFPGIATLRSQVQTLPSLGSWPSQYGEPAAGCGTSG